MPSAWPLPRVRPLHGWGSLGEKASDDLPEDHERLDLDVRSALVLHVRRGHEPRGPELFGARSRVFPSTPPVARRSDERGPSKGAATFAVISQPPSFERISHELRRALCSQVVQVDVAGPIRGALHDVDDAVGDLEAVHHEPRLLFWLSLWAWGSGVSAPQWRAGGCSRSHPGGGEVPALSSRTSVTSMRPGRAQRAEREHPSPKRRDDAAIRIAELHTLEDQVPTAKKELLNCERSSMAAFAFSTTSLRSRSPPGGVAR